MWKLKWTHSVVTNSLQPHGLQPTRLLRPWDSPGKSTGVGCHRLLQGIFPTQDLPGFSRHRDRNWVSLTAGRLLTVWATRGSFWHINHVNLGMHNTDMVGQVPKCKTTTASTVWHINHLINSWGSCSFALMHLAHRICIMHPQIQRTFQFMVGCLCRCRTWWCRGLMVLHHFIFSKGLEHPWMPTSPSWILREDWRSDDLFGLSVCEDTWIP